MISICFFSSFIFLFNIIYSYLKNEIIYCILFLFLLITSLLFHYYKNVFLLFIDKISILAIFSFGLYKFLQKITIVNTYLEYLLIVVILLCFIIVNYLYVYGYLVNKYCFCNNSYACEICHSILHMFVSIGHNCIIYIL
jgi:Na+/citrate or Na+/malate symporter